MNKKNLQGDGYYLTHPPLKITKTIFKTPKFTILPYYSENRPLRNRYDSDAQSSNWPQNMKISRHYFEISKSHDIGKGV